MLGCKTYKHEVKKYILIIYNIFSDYFKLFLLLEQSLKIKYKSKQIHVKYTAKSSGMCNI